ncbi:MAG: hypothetical protein C0467_19390 [Planctomycetaceae bacterium]|nr:hypothetical protein [Planctomycetaceae bacterium]
MTSALDVAKYLIELAGREPDEAEPITHLRLQKLLYYAQGWHLGLFGRSLFAEPVLAMKAGPVVSRVSEVVMGVLGDNLARPLTAADLGPSNLVAREKVFLETIWQKYRAYSATGLKELSQAEMPWSDARAGLPHMEEASAEITADSLRRFFASRPEARVVPFATLEAVYEAEAEDREANRKGVPFEELRRRRRVAAIAGQEQT